MMGWMKLLDVLTLLAYIALSADVIFQIRRIRITKSSHDISLAGLTVRYIAIIIIMVKFIKLGDFPLIFGQGIIAMTFTFYFILALTYFRHKG